MNPPNDQQSCRIKVEACVESMYSVMVAQDAGAHRIELNSALALGGLTPSISLLEQIKSASHLRVICMVRPRPGNFFYSDVEFQLMLADAKSLLQHGADGLAIGVLDESGAVDENQLQAFRDICGDKELVFHRAFDCTCHAETSMESLIESGVDRVLTSGGRATAIDGQHNIGNWISRFGSKIEILPGSGLNSSNVLEFVKATGCDQVHGTFSCVEETGATFEPTLSFNDSLGMSANQKRESSADEIRKTIQSLLSLED